MTSKDSSLYGAKRARNLNNGKEISSSTTLSFTSQLSSLISSSSNTSRNPIPSRTKPKKSDIFTKHNRNTAKRAKRDLEPDHSGAFAQKHSTDGEPLERSAWERSQRKMEEKARLYAAMKRGDVEDEDERYAVDFDQKWAETQGQSEKESQSDSDGDGDIDGASEQVEYLDEFGRTRTGTRLEAARAQTAMQNARFNQHDDRFTARPSAPASVIYGDAIQYEAFNPDAPVAVQMEELARKRDKSETPPPGAHFDSTKEVRTKGTGFFQFSGDAEQRKRQMEDLEAERVETEKIRAAREAKLTQRRRELDARRDKIQQQSAKRKANDFLEELGMQATIPIASSRENAHGKEDMSTTGVPEQVDAATSREKDDKT